MWNSLHGYVMIRLEGLGLERMLNRMLKDGIAVSNVKREGRGRMTLMLRARDFPRLRKLRRGTRCRIHITERRGVPFFIARFRFRRLLVLGALALGLLIFIASTRVWSISVEGCDRVPQAVVMQALADAGVKTGMARAKIEPPALGQFVRSYDKRIAWAGVSLSGVTLDVQIVEAEPIPAQPDKSKPADIVAGKDGIVEKVTALAGKAGVKPGDAVRRGDVLIHGDATREGAAERYLVHAEGTVTAKVWYEGRVTLPCTEEKLLRSGLTEPYTALEMAGMTLFRAGTRFSHYEIVTEGAATTRGLILPLRLVRGLTYELVEREVPAEQDEVTAEALFRAELAALDDIPRDARILKKVQTTQVLPDGSVRASVAVCALESIGITKRLA